MNGKVCLLTLICIFSLPLLCFAYTDYYNAEEVYGGRLPEVRSQGEYDNCWCYSAISAVESSLVANDYADFSVMGAFSPTHMASCINMTDDWYYSRLTRTKKSGGNRESSVAYLARAIGGGPVSEKNFPLPLYEKYTNGWVDYKMLLFLKKEAMLTKASFITEKNEASSFAECEKDDDGNILNITYKKNEQVIDEIKKAIIECGGVSASYYAYEKIGGSYFNDENASYCVPWEDYIEGKTPDGNKIVFTEDGYEFRDTTNHSVLIVGWDDNYSYENFNETPKSFDGEKYTFENGAWIVKGSWGKDFGKDGFEYISYMDPTIGHFATAYELEYTNKNKEITHTPKGLMGSVKFSNTKYGIMGLNRFEGEERLINFVGLYICDIDASYEVMIDASPTEELKKLTKREFAEKRLTLIDIETGDEAKILKFDKKGYYLFRLKEPVSAADFDLYVRCTVDSKKDLLLPTGNEFEKNDDFVPNVTRWAAIDKWGSTTEWKNIDTNWAVSVFYTEESFEKPKVTLTDNSVQIEAVRYKNDEECIIAAAFYKDGKVIKRHFIKPEFNSFGYYKEEIENKSKADCVKVILKAV